MPANVPWIDTGLDLAPGQSISLTASGGISFEARVIIPYHGSRLQFVQGQSADGSSAYDTSDLRHPFVAPGLPGYSLVGKVGNTAPFEIGSRATFYSPTGGRLYLSVNANSFERNSGAWIVTWTQGVPAASGTAPVASAGPTSPATFDYFHDQLAPYGNWVQVPQYGWAWNPAVAVTDPSWRPYADQGQWVYTDTGLYWQSAYPWGDIAFHYGRWAYETGYGWLWVPAYDWAPSWVAWRHAEADGYVGWAPCRPRPFSSRVLVWNSMGSSPSTSTSVCRRQPSSLLGMIIFGTAIIAASFSHPKGSASFLAAASCGTVTVSTGAALWSTASAATVLPS